MEYLSVFSPNAGKMRTRITPNTDTFQAVTYLRQNYLTQKKNNNNNNNKNDNTLIFQSTGIFRTQLNIYDGAFLRK